MATITSRVVNETFELADDEHVVAAERIPDFGYGGTELADDDTQSAKFRIITVTR